MRRTSGTSTRKVATSLRRRGQLMVGKWNDFRCLESYKTAIWCISYEKDEKDDDDNRCRGLRLPFVDASTGGEERLFAKQGSVFWNQQWGVAGRKWGDALVLATRCGNVTAYAWRIPSPDGWILLFGIKGWQIIYIPLHRFSEWRVVLYVSRDGFSTEPTEPCTQAGHGGKKDTN